MPCPRGTYAAAAGATACTPCAPFASTPGAGARLAAACACQPGYYPWGGEGDGRHNCTVCADGALCPGGGTVFARPGWCEAAPQTFRHCCEPDACPGGLGASCASKAALAAGGGGGCDVRQARRVRPRPARTRASAARSRSGRRGGQAHRTSGGAVTRAGPRAPPAR